MKKNLSLICFTDDPDDLASGKDFFVAVIPSSISTKGKLFYFLEDKLRFPYFGHTWDALWDLFNDFHWIKEKQILIIHRDLPLDTKPHELMTYIEILNDAAKAWKTRKEHNLIVSFPKETESKIGLTFNKI